MSNNYRKYGVIAGITGLVGSTGLVAACGGTSATKVPPDNAPTNPPASVPASPSKTASPTSGPVGTTFKISDDISTSNGSTAVYTVQALKVADPASPDNSFDAAPGGSHLVGVEFVIKGISGSVQDDANSNAVVTGRNSQTYQSGFEGLADGTDFDSGSFNTSPGSTSVGWVSFEVKDGVAVQSVEWNPAGGVGGSPVTWTR
jgi:hypothetical protein